MNPEKDIPPLFQIGTIILNISVAAIATIIVFLIVKRGNSKSKPGFLHIFYEKMFFDLGNTSNSLTNKKISNEIAQGAMVILTFITISNVMGLLNVPIILDSDGKPMLALGTPTSSLSVTFGLSIFIGFYCIYLSFKHQSWKYIIQIIIVLPIFTVLLNVFTLAIRLFANMFAGEAQGMLIPINPFSNIPMFFVGILLTSVTGIMTIMTGVIQAYVFTLLSIVYLAQATGIPNEEVQRERAFEKRNKEKKMKG